VSGVGVDDGDGQHIPAPVMRVGQQQAQQQSIVGLQLQKFEGLVGRKLEDNESMLLVGPFHAILELAFNDRLSINDAAKQLRRINAMLRSTSIKRLIVAGWSVDGVIAPASGRAILYHLFQLSTGSVKCGKVSYLGFSSAHLVYWLHFVVFRLTLQMTRLRHFAK
jgi:hypothetical protein